LTRSVTSQTLTAGNDANDIDSTLQNNTYVNPFAIYHVMFSFFFSNYSFMIAF